MYRLQYIRVSFSSASFMARIVDKNWRTDTQ